MAQFETKGRFDGFIMKHTYTDGDSAATESMVIDEATGEVIAESSGSGGGGDSDFTTAEVKVRFINVGEAEIPATQNFNIDGMPMYITGEVSNYSVGAVSSLSASAVAVNSYKEVTVNVILYKGTCIAHPLFDSETVLQDGLPVKVEGDISIAENVITITGDCTFSIDVVYNAIG